MADSSPLVYLVAGEPSGDRLGAGVMRALAADTGGAVRFAGVGGPAMAEAGLETLFPMADLSVMGAAEVVPRLPLLLRRMSETVADAQRRRPDVILTIDSPDFCFRVAARLHRQGCGFPLVHFVAPTVWAWRPGRARKIARFLDHLLCLLPFEPPYFEREGLAATFVGHPVVEGGADGGDGQSFRQRHGVGPETKLLAVLPGSRHSETGRLLPVFGDTMAQLADRVADLAVVVPTVETVAAEVGTATRSWAVPATVVEGDTEKFDAFAAADAALAASGTVALELAMAATPAVIAYRLNPVSAWLARRIIHVDYVNLINLILARPAVPELLLEDCRPEKLASAVAALLTDTTAANAQRQAYGEALTRLGRGGPSPSVTAARTILPVIEEGGRRA